MCDDIYRLVGAKIVYFRKIRACSQEELAVKAGMSRTRISLIECGKCHFTMDTIIVIAQTLDIELTDIFAGISVRKVIV